LFESILPSQTPGAAFVAIFGLAQTHQFLAANHKTNIPGSLQSLCALGPGAIMKLKLPVISFCFGIAIFAAHAMDISTKSADGLRYVSAKGPIVAGDAERLRVALQSADREHSGNKIIVLNSPGGRVDVAVAMAEIMDHEKVSTIVLPGASCASACAQILFFSGNYRFVLDGGYLGIHSCSKNDTRDDLCNEEIALNAIAHSVPHGTVMAFMKGAGPSEMMWFNSQDADCWGFTLWPPEDHRGIERGDIAPCVRKILRELYGAGRVK
jgi:Clp protease